MTRQTSPASESMVTAAGRAPLDRRALLRLGLGGAGAAGLAGRAETRRGAAAQEGTPAAEAGVPGSGPPYVFDTENIVKGGRLVAGRAFPRQTLYPLIDYSIIFEPLVYLDPNTLQAAPLLAAEWEVSNDGTVYTFRLREGVTWHDGAPFTSEDVRFTYDLIRDPASGFYAAATLSEQIAGVEAPDASTFVLTTSDPYAPLLVNMVGYFILPAHLLGDVPVDQVQGHDFGLNPVGTGPFALGEFRPGELTTFVANPDYYQGAPALESYTEKIVSDENVMLQQVQTGEIDAGALSATFYEQVKSSPTLVPATYDTATLIYFAYNLDPERAPLFADVEVRQALFHAIDRQTVVDRLLDGLGVVANGTQPPISSAYQPDKLTTQYDYDPARAAAMLDASGWVRGDDGIRTKDGRQLAFRLHSYAGFPALEGYALAIQEQFRTIGVDAQPMFEDSVTTNDRFFVAHNFEAAVGLYGFRPDPDQSSFWKTDASGNLMNYSNPKVDALLDEGLRTIDPERRKAIYLEIENVVLADAPALVLHFDKGLYGVNARVRNYFPSGVSQPDLYNAHLWYVTDGR